MEDYQKNSVKSLSCVCFALMLLFLACKPKPNILANSDEGKIKIKIRGSESELNLVNYFASEFCDENKNVIIRAVGGGSGTGIESLLESNVDLAISSRPINEDELEDAQTRGLVPVPVIVGLDAVAIITNHKVGVDSLSLDKLTRIFNGSIRNWKEVGGEDTPIKVYRRGDKSGTYFYISDRLGIKEYALGTIVKGGNNEIIEAVKKDKGAISYVGLGSLTDANGRPNPNVWAIRTFYDGGKAHSPYEIEAVKSGEYPLVRPLYQYVIGFPKGYILEFLKFELKEAQQMKIEAHGYFPITPVHHQINFKNIPELKKTHVTSAL